MITEQQKEDIYDSLCYFYTSTRFNKTNLKLYFKRDYNNKEDFEKILFKENTRIFFRYAITLKGKDFLNCIKNEYDLFCIYNEVSNDAKKNWLNHTSNFIVPINGLSGFINKIDTISFVKWHDKKIKKLQPNQTKNLISKAQREIENKFDKVEPQQFQKENDKKNILEFENKFDKVEPNIVYEYFNNNLVKKGYLTIKDLEKYLVLAFQDLEKPKEKFSFSNLHIEKIRTIFYTYFREIANKPHGKKSDYAQLLGNYFNSFTTQKVNNNFANGYKLVRK